MLDDLLKLPNGARFYRADLHNHTPRDPAFHCDGMNVDTEEQKRAFAREYVRFARLVQGLDIIGITEHNDVLWLPYIQTAADELNAELEGQGQPERLVVMPGVELGAMNSGKRSIHVLALLDPGTKASWIDSFISTLDLMPDARFQGDGKPTAAPKSFSELCQAISSKSGIAIAAHVSSKHGLFCDMEGGPRVTAYNCDKLWAVEIPGKVEDLAEGERRIVQGGAETYGPKRVACLNGSDGRGLKEAHDGRLAIGARSTRIKMSRIGVEGLRQAFIDFDSRIRLEEEVKEADYPCIVGVEIEGGFLGGKPDPGEADAARPPFRLHLNPNLNTIVGGRGVGKSALIEAIRYVFDLEAKSDETRAQAERLLNTTLRPGAKATVYYQLPNGTHYRIERIRYESPKVYDAATGEEKPGVDPKSIWSDSNPVQIYSQKEIYEISNDLMAQLALLDNYLSETLRPLLAQERDLARVLEKNAEDILRFSEDVAVADQQSQELPGILLQIQQLQQRDALNQFARHESHRREERLLDDAASDIERLTADLQQFMEEHPALAADRLGEHLRQGLPHTDLLARQAALMNEIDQLLAARLESLIAEVQAIWAKGADECAQWQADYVKVKADYFALLREFNDVSADRLGDLNRRKDALENIRREADKRRARIVELKQERQQKLAELRALRREEIFHLRHEKAQELTNRLAGALKVNVLLEGQRDKYQDFLKEAFAGTKIQTHVMASIAQAQENNDTFLDPLDLVEAIRKEQENPTEANSTLAQTYNVSEAFCKRLAALPDETLYRLETYAVPDKIDIRLKVGEQYRSLMPPRGEFGLSTGQRCTAILSLLLVERNTPLVIDQPEDDLDNQFVFDEIVTTLRREKEQRQFLIATHNANIPVSGDAEQIIVLDADEIGGWIAQQGSIDDPSLRDPVETILEGGRIAFHIRKEKYGLPD